MPRGERLIQIELHGHKQADWAGLPVDQLLLDRHGQMTSQRHDSAIFSPVKRSDMQLLVQQLWLGTAHACSQSTSKKSMKKCSQRWDQQPLQF